MSALAVGMGFAAGALGVGTNGAVGSKTNIEDTITRLEQERDKYQKQQETARSDYLDNRIKNLENRINNLQSRLDKMKAEEDNGECETCANRKYQDESDDPGVSFKSATKVSPGSAESAVRAHENEHVTRNQAKAGREGKEIVYQSVIIKRGICPECGTSYVAGGETTTVTRDKPDDDVQNVKNAENKEAEPNAEYTSRQDERFNVGLVDRAQMMGNLLNIVA